MIVYFADRDLAILGMASTSLPEGFVLTNDNKIEDIDTGVASFEFEINFRDDDILKAKELAKEGNYVLRQSGDQYEAYTIIEVEINTLSQTIYCYAEDGGLDLLNGVALPEEATEAHPAAWYITEWLNYQNSGFEIGINEISSLSRKLIWEGESTITERIRSVATQFDNAEISYSFKIDGFRITKKYVNIFKKRGKDVAQELRLGREVGSIIERRSIANLATGYYAKGGTPDATDANPNPQPITLRGFSYDDGDFYTNDVYILNRTAHKEWSRLKSGYIIKTFEYDTISQQELFNRALAALKKAGEPEINYEVELLYLPENLSIGDTVRVVDDNGELYLSARLLRLEVSEANNTRMATFGEFLIKTSGISEQVRQLSEEFSKLTPSHTMYTWIAWADDAVGSGISLSSTDKPYIGIATNKFASTPDITDASVYTWTRIEGIDGQDGRDGEDGAPGTDGKDGKDGKDGTDGVNGTSIRNKGAWAASTAYVSNATYLDVVTYNGSAYICKSSHTSGSTFDNSKWDLLAQKGDQGIPGTNGQDGAPGRDGTNGTSNYIHIKYAAVANPTDSQMSEVPNTYIGICVNETVADPTTASSYTWSKFEGTDGQNGTPGAPGTDGKDSYVHFAYSISSDGSEHFSTTAFDGASYIGVLTDNTQADSTNYRDYEWSQMKGEDGNSPVITTSKSGNVTIVYADGVEVGRVTDGTDGTTPTITATKTGGVTTIKSNGTAIATINDGSSVTIQSATKTDGTTTVVLKDSSGTKTLTIVDGEDGTNGTPGLNGYVHIAWANSADGTTDFSTTVSANKKYIGSYTDNTAADSTTPSKYNWSLIKGEDGQDGVSPIVTTSKSGKVTTITINDASGTKTATVNDGTDGARGATWYAGTAITGTSTTPTIFSGSGVASAIVGDHYLNTTTQNVYRCTVAGGPSAAKWVYEQNIKGEQGTPGTNGTNGTNGKNSYFHVKYSNDGGQTFTGNSGEDPGSYIGTYSDNTATDSTSVSSYTWVKIEGEDGTDGQDGYSPTATVTKSGTTATITITDKNGTTSKTVSDGTSVTVSSITYATSTTESQPSDSEFTATTAPTVAEGNWLWTKVTFSNGSSVYTKSKQGKSGTNGTSYYTFIRYSTNSDGNPMVETPTDDTLYIGVYTGTSSTAPAEYGSYTWSRYTGKDGKMLYGTCSTTASTAAKSVACADAKELYSGLTIMITFSTANTAAAPTLNVNSLGAKNIYFGGANASSSNLFLWGTGASIQFTYNGTAWVPVGHPCTYYGACTTAAGTAAKVSTINQVVVCKGTTVNLQMTNANTVASATLNISSTGAKTIYANGAVLSADSPYNWIAGSTVAFTFDGTYWRLGDTSANSKAVAAQTAADAALTSANGKNKVYHQASQPSGGTYITGDTWFDTDDGYKMYTYNGSSWVAETFGTNAISDLAITNAKIADATIQNAKIATVDAGKITTGTLDADRIAANSIVIGKLDTSTQNTISNASTNSELALSRSTEYIIGTQTAATGSWTGVTTDTELVAGKTIAYKLPYAGSGNASLNLTLAGGGTTGAKAVYLNTTRVTTHFGAGAVINMTYDGSYWRASSIPNSNTYDRRLHNNAVLAATAITAAHLIGGTASGYKNLAASVAFDLSYPILYASAAINAAAAASNTYEAFPSVNFSTSGTIQGATANKVVYLKGSISGNTFTCASSNYLTCTVPTSADSMYYIPLGVLANGSTTTGYFSSSNRLYAYLNGAFQAVDTAAKDLANDAAKTATNYITYIDSTNGIRVYDGQSTNQNVNYAQLNSSGMQIVKGGTQTASFGDSIVLGETERTRANIDFNSMELIDKNNNVYFSVGDLRDDTGYANISERFVGTGANRTYATTLITYVYTITIDGTATTAFTTAALDQNHIQITFTNAPADGAQIIVNGRTSSDYAKSYTLGTRGSEVIGPMSVSEGYQTDATAYASHSEGTSSKAYGNSSHAEGGSTTANGQYSHAEGAYTSTGAIGAGSHAEGYNSFANSSGSHAEGGYTVASAVASHAEGSNTTSSGLSSHAEGSYSVASGAYSHAQNRYTEAAGENQTAIGKYNIVDSGNSSTSNAFIIGNGTDDESRSNAFAVRWDGDVHVNGVPSIISQNGTYVENGTSVDTIKAPGNYIFALQGSTYTYTNMPFSSTSLDYVYMSVIAWGATNVVQIAWLRQGDGTVKYRKCAAGTWSSWFSIVTKTITPTFTVNSTDVSTLTQDIGESNGWVMCTFRAVTKVKFDAGTNHIIGTVTPKPSTNATIYTRSASNLTIQGWVGASNGAVYVNAATAVNSGQTIEGFFLYKA